MLSPAALAQRALWSSDPEGWARFSEPHTRPLFDAVLEAAAVGSGSRVLDLGCGTGLALRLASQRGAVVSGIDVSEAMLSIARSRVPEGDLREAELDALPFDDAGFDAVLAVNAFQFAADPRHAIGEAARVCAPGGRVVVGMFGDPAGVESRAIHDAMTALSPPERDALHAPFTLAAPGALEEALAAARLVVVASGEVACPWEYASADDAVRGLIGSAGGTRAVQDAGRERTEAAIRAALEPFTRSDGSVRMRNGMRWVRADKPRG